MKSLNFDQFIFESGLSAVSNDVEHALKDLDFGKMSSMTDAEALKFLNAVMKNDGNVKKVKKKDLNEDLNISINEDVFIDLSGKIGEILGLGISLDFIITKVALLLNKSADVDKVKKKVHNILDWINSATYIEDYTIVRFFAWIAKILGANGLSQKVIGKAGLIIILSVLIVTGIMAFPAIGSGPVALIFAAISSAAKMREIYMLLKDIWKMIKHPTDVDLTKIWRFL